LKGTSRAAPAINTALFAIATIRKSFRLQTRRAKTMHRARSMKTCSGSLRLQRKLPRRLRFTRNELLRLSPFSRALGVWLRYYDTLCEQLPLVVTMHTACASGQRISSHPRKPQAHAIGYSVHSWQSNIVNGQQDDVSGPVKAAIRRRRYTTPRKAPAPYEIP